VEPVEEKAMRLTPLARMASRTLKVATVFCSRSFAGCSVPKLDVGVGGEMKHEVAARHGGGQRGQVEVVAAHEREAGIFPRAGEEAFLAGGEIIPADDGDAVRQQAVDEVEPMKPAAPVMKVFCMNSVKND
jgi:hypothetical protein